MLEPDIRAFIVADAGINAIVAGRVHPLVLPQSSTVPAIVYQKISADRTGVMGSARGLGLATKLYQFAAYAGTQAEADDVADKLRQLFDGYVGAMGASTVRLARAVAERSDFEPQKAFYRSDVDVEFHVVETTL